MLFNTIMTNRSKYYDNHTLYVTSGVARKDQLYNSLKSAVKNGENNLYIETLRNHLKLSVNQPLNKSIKELEKMCKDNNVSLPKKINLETEIRVNLIVDKEGDYFGFGYIHVTNENVYWMLLGKNPDGSDRLHEYSDPNWVAPVDNLTVDEKKEKYSTMKWYEITDEEDKAVCPTIKEILSPLMPIPGYKYDKIQYQHLNNVARDGDEIQEYGYFELSRAYARDNDPSKVGNVLCSRKIPTWIPEFVFKYKFEVYANDSKGKYPIVNMKEGRNETGNIVFVEFDPNTKDAIFALLMTRKVHIIHPKNPNLKCSLIFDHAYDQQQKSNKDRYDNKSRSNSSSNSSRYDNKSRSNSSRYDNKSRDNKTSSKFSRDDNKTSSKFSRDDNKTRSKFGRDDNKSSSKFSRDE